MMKTSVDRFHQQLLASAASIWDTTLAHPFLTSVTDGSVRDETFKTWLVQDYLFVGAAIPFMGVLIAKSPSELRLPLAEAVAGLHRELDLFRHQAEAHDVSLQHIGMAPTCHAYVQFLMATVYERSYAESFAVLYCAEKAYLDAWDRVKRDQAGPGRWQAFIDNWTSPAFRGYVDWLAATVDTLAAGKSANDLSEMEQLFLMTARYEYLFWDMAASGETWPV